MMSSMYTLLMRAGRYEATALVEKASYYSQPAVLSPRLWSFGCMDLVTLLWGKPNLFVHYFSRSRALIEVPYRMVGLLN